jgi:hypothetical protein
MPRKTKKSAPIAIEFTFDLQPNGSIITTYSGADDRTHAIGDAVIAAIADVYDLVPTVVERRG